MKILQDTELEARRLAELKTYNILDTLTEKEYDDITFMASVICDVPVALISFMDEERQWFKSHKGVEIEETLREYSFCTHAINLSGELMIVPDARTDDRFKNNPLVTGETQVIFYAGVPLRNENGFDLGTVCVIDNKPRQLSADQMAALKVLASQVMSLLQIRKNNLLLEEIKQQLEARNAELNYSSRNLSLALQAGELGSYELDIRSGKMVTSLQCRRNFGLDAAGEFDFPDLLAMILPEDVLMVTTAVNNAIANHTTYAAEYRIMLPDGEIRWIQASGLPLYDEDRNVNRMAGVTRNITGQKTAEHKLQKAFAELELKQEKLNIVIDASELGTWEVDMKTMEITFSERFLNIVGFKKAGKRTLADTRKLIHPDDLGMRDGAFKEALRTGHLHYTCRIIREDGSLHWVESKGKVFYDKENNPAKVIGTISDITEEKKQQDILHKSEQKFRLLADSMPQHIWTADVDGNLDYYNQSVFDYSGLSPEEINKDGWLQIVHPEDREKNISQWIDSITKGTDFLFEHRFRRHDDTYRWQLSRAIPQKDTDGKIQMWVGTSTDIQEQKMFTGELESQVIERTKELAQKNIDLEKMNKELQSFAYISSHDLQEPLRKIQTFADHIINAEKDNLSEKGKDYFRRIQVAANRMQTLINDLLAYSRTATAERIFKKTDLNNIVAQVKDDLKEEIELKHATIETNEMCEVNIIPFQFRQLLQNLLTNSLKFSKVDIAPVIKISSNVEKGSSLENEKLLSNINYCHISVADNGIGFEESYSEKIFELFQRLHGRAVYSGTGVGLAIVKKIVENHNGIITATGQPGEGARFDIYFPLEDNLKLR